MSISPVKEARVLPKRQQQDSAFRSPSAAFKQNQVIER